MIDDKRISLLILCHRRVGTIGKVLTAWKDQPVDEIYLIDCTQGSLDLCDIPMGVKIVTFDPDPGNKARHAVALITQGEIVIQADDDVLPHPGFVIDLYNGWKKANGGIVGIIGRTFHGDNYYKNTKFYKASDIENPQRVGFVGVVYLCDREHLAYDMRDMEIPCNDIYWQMKAMPGATKHVVPTKNYENLPSCEDDKCLFHDKGARIIRQMFYNKYWTDNYKDKGLIY